MMRISKSGKWLWYTLYVILLTLVFLYYRFPSEAFRDYLQTTVEEMGPGFSLSVRNVSPSFPLDFRLEQPVLSRKEGPEKTFFKANSLIFGPDVWSFLQGKFSYSFDCSAYGGDLEGRIGFTEHNLQVPYAVSIALKKIIIKDKTLLQGLFSRYLDGTMEGNVTYNGKSSILAEGSGEADLKLSQGAIKLSRPDGGAESIPFKDLMIKLVLKNQKIDLTRVELKGRELQGELSGAITLAKEFPKSSLNLRGAVEPFPDLLKSSALSPDTLAFIKLHLKRGRLSFMVRGTIEEPKPIFF